MWLAVSAGATLGISADMARLRVNRVVFRPLTWLLVSVVAGPTAVAIYLFARWRVRKQLIDHALELVGDASQLLDVRCARLRELHRSGLIGDEVFLTCLRLLVEPLPG